MHFSQKALIYNRAEFEFGDRLLDILIDDGRLKVGFSVPYHEIYSKQSTKSFPEKAIHRLGVALSLGGLFGLMVSGGNSNPADMSATLSMVCMFLGLILIAARRYARFEATRIPVASKNAILVFHDGQQQAILNEIYKRRKSELLRLYGEVDPLGHPQLELKKFLWLKEEKIISDPEFEEARMKIAALSQPHSGLY